MTATHISLADTAKLVRAALKAKFPAVKFSVRSKSYSGGASIDVRWTNGPTSGEVDTVAKQFAGATFDGMQDLKEYRTTDYVHPDGTIEQVHYGADYVFCTRDLGDANERCARHLCTRHGVEWRGDNTRIGDEWASTLAHRILSRYALPDGYHGIRRTARQAGLIEDMFEAF